MPHNPALWQHDTDRYSVVLSHDGSVYHTLMTGLGYTQALVYIKQHIRAMQRDGWDMDILNETSGRLMSWTLEGV